MIELPIIIVGDGQVEMFASQASLKRSVEAVDARLYRAYDSRGRTLRLNAEFKQGTWLGIRWVKSGAVSLEPLNQQALCVDELRSALLDWWRRTSGSPDASTWTLEQLVKAIAQRDGVR